MALDMNPDARPHAADAVMEDTHSPDVKNVGTHHAASAQTGKDLRATQERIEALLEEHEQHTERLAGLEIAARAAIDAVTEDASNRITKVVDQAEQRIMDAVSLSEQQQKDMTRWHNQTDEQIRAQIRELGEWDETLTEMRQDIGGLREMAEASVSLASGDLDQRWNRLERDLRDILATAESDERARWEAFMAGAADSIASHSGIDPAELETARTELAKLSTTATHTVSQMQQSQREQLAAMRSEINTLIESERARIGAGLDAKIDDARTVFTTQVKSLQDWQQQVGKDVGQLRQTAQAAESGVLEAKSSLQREAQAALATIRAEVEMGVTQARAVAQAEISVVRADCERMVKRAQQKGQTFQTLALIIAMVAFLVGIAAFGVTFLHLH